MNRTKAGAADPVVEDSGDLAKLVDQVVEGHARIVVARDGEPKAVLVSMEEYARLKQEASTTKPEKKFGWEEWSNEARKLREDILAYRGNEPVDLDKLVREMRDELEGRDAYDSGS